MSAIRDLEMGAVISRELENGTFEDEFALYCFLYKNDKGVVYEVEENQALLYHKRYRLLSEGVLCTPICSMIKRACVKPEELEQFKQALIEELKQKTISIYTEYFFLALKNIEEGFLSRKHTIIPNCYEEENNTNVDIKRKHIRLFGFWYFQQDEFKIYLNGVETNVYAKWEEVVCNASYVSTVYCKEYYRNTPWVTRDERDDFSSELKGYAQKMKLSDGKCKSNMLKSDEKYESNMFKSDEKYESDMFKNDGKYESNMFKNDEFCFAKLINQYPFLNKEEEKGLRFLWCISNMK